MTARDHSAVVEFPKARVRPAAALPEGASAEVVIFTGVRVERLYDLAERLPSARKRQRGTSATGDIEFGR
jgi:hypothetical protein